jgi:hypothetical protein
MITFENPNTPQQPQKGVYAWYAKKGNEVIPIYIGEAGKKHSVLPKGTLYRGVCELQRNTFCSNSKSTPPYDMLDTDFIVGTAVLFFSRNGYECIWKHISDDPQRESRFVAQQRPILQDGNTTDIRPEFKLKKGIANYWKPKSLSDVRKEEKIREADTAISEQLAKYLF